MTNLQNNSTIANLQTFYKEFPMQSHASVHLPKKAILYKVPDVFIDKVAEAARTLIIRLSLPLQVIKSDAVSNIFIVKEVQDAA